MKKDGSLKLKKAAKKAKPEQEQESRMNKLSSILNSLSDVKNDPFSPSEFGEAEFDPFLTPRQNKSLKKL